MLHPKEQNILLKLAQINQLVAEFYKKKSAKMCEPDAKFEEWPWNINLSSISKNENLLFLNLYYLAKALYSFSIWRLDNCLSIILQFLYSIFCPPPGETNWYLKKIQIR